MSWAGCRWRWSRRARTCRPRAAASPGTWGCSGRGGPSCSDRGIRPGMTSGSPPPGRWRSPQLGQAGPAAGLLRLVACCAAEDIPLDLLLRPGLAAEDFDAVVAPVLVPLLDDDLARDEAVAGLRRFSLISAPRDGLVSVHRLVQAITLDQLPPQRGGRLAAGRRRGDRGRAARRPGGPGVLAGVRGAAAARPGRAGPGQLRHVPAGPVPRRERQLRRGAGRTAAGPARPGGNPGRRAPRHAHRPRLPGLLDRAGGGCGRGPGPVRRAGAGPRAGLRRRAPRHAHRPRQPGLLDRGGGGCGRGPGPVRRAAAGPRAGLRRRAPRHAHRPRQPGPLDRGGGGCGRGPGPVRRAAAGPRAGLRRRAPRTR